MLEAHGGAYGYPGWVSAMDPAVHANGEAMGYTTRVRHVVGSLMS